MRAAGENGLSRSEIAVLDAIRARGQATRADVAGAIGLGMAMTGRLVTRLQEAGLVRETARTGSAGLGRQALLLELQPDVAYVAGIDIGSEVVHLLIANLRGDVRAYREVPSSHLADKTQAEIVGALAGLVGDVVRAAAIPPARLAVAGVAVTGIIDGERGLCLIRSHTPGWENFPLAADLGAALGLPVVLDETARAKALAELRVGAAREARHYLYVDAGTAIGATIVIDGQPFRGISGLAGELGHVIVEQGGTLCRCGNRGCLQATASARAIVARAREHVQRGVFSSLAQVGEALTLDDVAAAASGGDKMALGLLTEAGERLGEAIAMALNLLGMDLVVLGGRLALCSPVVLDAAERIVQLRVLPMVPQPRRLVRSSLGSDASARGIAAQAVDWIFADPFTRLLSVVNDGHTIGVAHVGARGPGAVTLTP
jgi:predicted NBD/HSP70 family sugar kinase